MVWYDTNETLEAMGYGPNARRQQHEDNMRVLEAAAVGGIIGYGASRMVESWRQSRTTNPQAQEAQNLRQAEAQARTQPSGRSGAGNGQSASTNRWILEQQRRWKARQGK